MSSREIEVSKARDDKREAETGRSGEAETEAGWEGLFKLSKFAGREGGRPICNMGKIQRAPA
jgi:hypothetical protein